MPITTKGTDLRLTLDSATGLYDIADTDDGNPEEVSDESHAVLVSLYARLGEWFGDQSGSYGSLLHTVTQDSPETASKLEAYALEGLQPLIDERRLRPGPRVRATRIGAGNYRVEVDYETVSGVAGRAAVPVAPVTF